MSNEIDLADEQLVFDYLSGNEKALEILINRYLKLIYNFVYCYTQNSFDAEDITQEVFVKMWRNIKKFNVEKKFKTWIFTIAKNTSFDFIKKKKDFLLSDFENEEGDNILENSFVDDKLLPDEILERKDLADLLFLATKKLPVNYQLVIFLYYSNNFNFREIAELLNESINTVKSRHRRAIILLKNNLAKISIKN